MLVEVLVVDVEVEVLVVDVEVLVVEVDVDVLVVVDVPGQAVSLLKVPVDVIVHIPTPLFNSVHPFNSLKYCAQTFSVVPAAIVTVASAPEPDPLVPSATFL